MPKKLASVIIPTKDKMSRLRLVLQALEPQINEDVEVIIVMDGCKQESINEMNDLQLSFKPILIDCVKNIGRSAARNRGIRYADGEILIFLDDDRIPGLNYIKKHITQHQSKCVLIGERKQIYFTEEQIYSLYLNNVIKSNFRYIIKKSRFEYVNKVRELFFLKPDHPLRWFLFVTGNVSIEKNDLETVGFFDENYTGWGYEDTDLGYRLAKAGIKFVKDSTLINYHLAHDNNKLQKSIEERRNLNYFANKFKDDAALQNMLLLMKLKSKFTAYI